MSGRPLLLSILLGLPAVFLLAFGPRGKVDVPEGRIIIRYWEKWTGVEARAMQRIVDRFNETVGARENIWVEYCAISNVDQRLLIATAGGDPPEVAGLFDHAVAQFADQNALLELDDLAAEFGIRPADFAPIWWNIGRYNDRLYALPSSPFTVGLYYNRRLFREAADCLRAAGLDPDRPPQTIAELDQYARCLTRRDESGKLVQLGFTVSPAMLGWWHWIWPNFFDTRLWDGKRFQIDTSAGREAYEWIAGQRVLLGSVGLDHIADPAERRRRAIQDLLAFEAAAGSIEGPTNPFLSERLAMVFQGPWMSNWIRTYTPSLDYGVAFFPSVSAERRNCFASADVFVIPRGCREPRAAMRFLAFVMQPEVMEQLCREHCKNSPLAAVSREFFDTHPNPHIRVFDEMARSEFAFSYPQTPVWAQLWTETLYMLENIIRGVADPREQLTRTQRKADAIVAEYERMAARRRQ